MTAAEYAAILDPERKVAGWWRQIYHDHFDYIGPDNLHTARSEAWRGEEWLEARRIQVAREFEYGLFQAQFKTTVFKWRISPDMRDGMRKILAQNTDHAAASAEAVRRVNDGQK